MQGLLCLIGLWSGWRWGVGLGLGWSWELGQRLEKQKETEKVLFPNTASLENLKQKGLPLQSGGVFHVSAHAELFYVLAINLSRGGAGARLAQL